LALSLATLAGATAALIVANQPSSAEQAPPQEPPEQTPAEPPAEPPPQEAPAEPTEPAPSAPPDQEAPSTPPAPDTPRTGTPPPETPEPAPDDADNKAEEDLLDAVQGGRKSLRDHLATITDCPAKSNPKPGTNCYEAASFASKVIRRFTKEVDRPERSLATGPNFVVAVAALAAMRDNSKPPKWAFPSVHAALPVLLKLALWAEDPDPEKARSAKIAARRLSTLLVRNDIEARKAK
jgi:hypothetical protein